MRAIPVQFLHALPVQVDAMFPHRLPTFLRFRYICGLFIGIWVANRSWRIPPCTLLYKRYVLGLSDDQSTDAVAMKQGIP